jgi:hypothetical protein
VSAASDAVTGVRDQHRTWLRELFTRLAREAGTENPEAVSAQLVLLSDGAMVAAHPDNSAEPGRAAGSVTVW